MKTYLLEDQYGEAMVVATEAEMQQRAAFGRLVDDIRDTDADNAARDAAWLERRISDWMSYEPDLGTDDDTMPADDITDYS
jgi:hypothetical protein